MVNFSEKVKQQLLSWNNTDIDYESTTCIQNKLEQTAAEMPEAIAVSYKGENLTYRSLNRTANAMANILLSKQIQVEDFVVVYLERRLELLISIYGILKAGGVYVPISRDYPKERINNIVEDVKPKVIITSKELSQNISEDQDMILVDGFLEKIDQFNSEKPDVKIKPNNLAYSIFTSGTTGRPKGVLIEHQSVLNRIGWMQKMYPITKNDVLLQKTTITFDVSIWELFWAGFVGAKLVFLPNGDEKSPENMLNCIKTEKVSVIHFVPSMFTTFVKYLWSIYPQNNLESIIWLFCSGEELYQNVVLDYYKLNKEFKNNTTIVNLYGPTEATVDITYYTCPEDAPSKIPIGKPIDNTKIFIINENNELLPPNETGELVISGVNLARGYLNREELTNEKFLELDVFGESVRVYKTGDYANFNDNGELIYSGRIDKQVKLRGFRIELSEIENTILGFENISECACLVKDEKMETAQIVSFIISKNGEKIIVDKLKTFLKNVLPEYMIPSNYYQVDEFTLTKNGKLDRDALFKKIETNQIETIHNSTNYEKELIEVWSKILKNKSISPTSNFFDLGGNSLLLVQLSILMKKELNIDINIIALMQYPTIKSLASFLKKK